MHLFSLMFPGYFVICLLGSLFAGVFAGGENAVVGFLISIVTYPAVYALARKLHSVQRPS